MLTADDRLARRPGGPARRGGRPAHRPPASKGGSFWVLVSVVAVLCLVGVVMVLSASSIVSLSQYGTPWHFFIRQWMWLSIGTASTRLCSAFSRCSSAISASACPVWVGVGMPTMFAVMVQ